jgi:hypothetical protein
MKKAAEAYKSWPKFAIYGTQVGGSDCGQQVIDFIKSFPEKGGTFDTHKIEIKSFK